MKVFKVKNVNTPVPARNGHWFLNTCNGPFLLADGKITPVPTPNSVGREFYIMNPQNYSGRRRRLALVRETYGTYGPSYRSRVIHYVDHNGNATAYKNAVTIKESTPHPDYLLVTLDAFFRPESDVMGGYTTPALPYLQHVGQQILQAGNV